MGIYWIALLISVFLAWVLTSRNVKFGEGRYGKITYTRVGMSFLPLFLIALFRWNVGVDVVYGTGYYYLEYSAIQAGNGNILGYETGFYWLMEICNALHLNLYLFYCVVTILFFVLVQRYLVKNVKNITLSLILFFVSDMYLFSFSTLRQALGIAFFLHPMSEVLNGTKYWKNWKFWLGTVLACSMHTSILYLLLVLIISRIHFRKKTILFFTIIGCILSPIIRVLLSTIVSYTYYFSKYFGSNEYQTEFTPTYFIIALLIFVPLILFYDKFTENENNYILVNVAAFAVILMINSQVLVMPYRIFPLLVPIYIVIICRLIDSLSYGKSIKYICCLYCILPFLFMFINQYYLNNASELFEYESIFQNMNQVW